MSQNAYFFKLFVKNILFLEKYHLHLHPVTFGWRILRSLSLY